MGSVISGPGRGVWRIGPSAIHGQGVMATRKLAPGSLIGVGIGYRMGFVPAVTSDFGAFINHSYEPSASLMFLNGVYWVVAAKTLDAEEEITVDYRKTPFYIRGPEPHYR
jgi:SET domain